MVSQKRKKQIRSTGVVHFWDLPQRSLVVLSLRMQRRFARALRKKSATIYGLSKKTGVSRPTLAKYLSRENPTIRLEILLELLDFLSISKEEVENQIRWIGCANDPGVAAPRLPFIFNSREGARLISAICNEGWISSGMYYSNQEETLHESVRTDAKHVFGDSVHVPSIRRDNDYVLSFSAILRHAVLLVMDLQSRIAVTNPHIPDFIINNSDCARGWLEQTISDEGGVRFYPHKYRREIVWRRSFSSSLRTNNLFDEEIKMLKNLGISCTTYKLNTYETLTGLKTRYQIRLCGKKTLEQVYELLLLPHAGKQVRFEALIASYSQ